MRGPYALFIQATTYQGGVPAKTGVHRLIITPVKAENTAIRKIKLMMAFMEACMMVLCVFHVSRGWFMIWVFDFI